MDSHFITYFAHQNPKNTKPSVSSGVVGTIPDDVWYAAHDAGMDLPSLKGVWGQADHRVIIRHGETGEVITVVLARDDFPLHHGVFDWQSPSLNPTKDGMRVAQLLLVLQHNDDKSVFREQEKTVVAQVQKYYKLLKQHRFIVTICHYLAQKDELVRLGWRKQILAKLDATVFPRLMYYQDLLRKPAPKKKCFTVKDPKDEVKVEKLKKELSKK